MCIFVITMSRSKANFKKYMLLVAISRNYIPVAPWDIYFCLFCWISDTFASRFKKIKQKCLHGHPSQLYHIMISMCVYVFIDSCTNQCSMCVCVDKVVCVDNQLCWFYSMELTSFILTKDYYQRPFCVNIYFPYVQCHLN